MALNGNTVHLCFTGREGSELKYYVIDPYKLCNVTATSSKPSQMLKSSTSPQVYLKPNRDAGRCAVSYHVDKASHVKAAIYDASGAHISTSVHSAPQAGSYTMDLGGKRLSQGLYLVRVEVDGAQVVSRKLIF
ncbi:MAG: T9SS type A sorting domain-containing protein [Chitinivibrionales bacterium]|nr:T9SS type A sorting domain-containing protein [Chitinivibrionales bacterium]